MELRKVRCGFSFASENGNKPVKAGCNFLLSERMSRRNSRQLGCPFCSSIAPHAVAETGKGKVSGSVRTELTLTDGAPVVHLNGDLDTSAFLVERAPAPGDVMALESGHLELRDGSTLTPLKLDAAVQFSRVLLQRLPQGDVSMEEARGNAAFQYQSTTETSASQHATTLDKAPASSVINAQGQLRERSSFFHRDLSGKDC